MCDALVTKKIWSTTSFMPEQKMLNGPLLLFVDSEFEFVFRNSGLAPNTDSSTEGWFLNLHIYFETNFLGITIEFIKNMLKVERGFDVSGCSNKSHGNLKRKRDQLKNCLGKYLVFVFLYFYLHDKPI